MRTLCSKGLPSVAWPSVETTTLCTAHSSIPARKDSIRLVKDVSCPNWPILHQHQHQLCRLFKHQQPFHGAYTIKDNALSTESDMSSASSLQLGQLSLLTIVRKSGQWKVIEIPEPHDIMDRTSVSFSAALIQAAITYVYHNNVKYHNCRLSISLLPSNYMYNESWSLLINLTVSLHKLIHPPHAPIV